MKLNNKHKMNPYKISVSKYSTHGILLNLIENLPVRSKVLDVGCNDGYLGQPFKDKYHFYGLDYMEETVKVAKRHYEDCIVYDINTLKKLPWNMRFDALIFADVLEHVIDGDSALNFFVKNYLKKGGTVIVSLPNVANWEIRLKLLFGRFDYTQTGVLDRTHLRLYTYKSALNLLESNGLKVTKSYGGTSFLGVFLKIFPFLKSLLAHNIIILAEKE